MERAVGSSSPFSPRYTTPCTCGSTVYLYMAERREPNPSPFPLPPTPPLTLPSPSYRTELTALVQCSPHCKAELSVCPQLPALKQAMTSSLQREDGRCHPCIRMYTTSVSCTLYQTFDVVQATVIICSYIYILYICEGPSRQSVIIISCTLARGSKEFQMLWRLCSHLHQWMESTIILLLTSVIIRTYVHIKW